jgi:hypothetical protein
MLPLPPVQTAKGHVVSLPADASAIAAGADPHVDWIIDRILDGGPFHLPEELAVR